MDAKSELLTLGVAATRIGGGAQVHHLHRLARRGLIPFQRAGRFHVVSAADLDVIREALERVGWVKPSEVAHAR